jgi:hypothetical protein
MAFQKEPAYPILMQLMAKYGLDRQDIAEIIGRSYRNTLKKINREQTGMDTIALFDIVEAGKITKFFKDKGENVTVDSIFLA